MQGLDSIIRRVVLCRFRPPLRHQDEGVLIDVRNKGPEKPASPHLTIVAPDPPTVAIALKAIVRICLAHGAPGISKLRQ